MTHIVAEPCTGCMYTDCVMVCPADCFHKGEKAVVIDPEECIDCGLCIDACPVSAIFSEDELPENWSNYKEWNATKAHEWPLITLHASPSPEKEDSPPDK